MEAKLINLDDYVLSGGGANGDSYDHKTDKSIMLKLYLPGKIEQPVNEMELARKVYNAGIPTPEPGDYVKTPDGRYGIRFRRIVGKKSYSRAIGDEPERAEEFGVKFAQECRKLHSISVDTSIFNSIKDDYCRLLEQNPFFTAAEKSKVEKFILDAPDSDKALHGDLQYSNLIFVGDQQYFIDLGDFAYGYNLFDIGMVYVCAVLTDTAFRAETFHMDDATSLRFWKAFAGAYFGTDRPLESIEEEVMPFAGLKTLIIERDTKCPMPIFRAALKSIL